MDEAFFEAFKCFEPQNDTKTNEEATDTSFIDCNINERASNNDTKQDYDEQKLNINSCKSMERLSQILTYYISWINTIESSIQDTNTTNTPSIGMFDIINSGKYLGTYNNTQLLNDFHHILQTHSYDTIHTLFTKINNHNQCVINNETKICQLLQRNYRSRNMNVMSSKHRQQIYYGYNISTEITTQQILDYIHSFIYHSYDLGFKLNPKHTAIFHDHLLNYKNQLIEEQTIEYSKTPKPPIFQAHRVSILYNQKIEVDKLTNESSNSNTDSEETEDSLSMTPQPPEMHEEDEKKEPTPIKMTPTPTQTHSSSPKLASHLTPSLSPNQDHSSLNSNTYLKPAMDSMILNTTPQTLNNMKTTQTQHDSKLLQHIKLSHSKIIITKQIMDEINDKSNQLWKTLNRINAMNGQKNCKYINILKSYKHLIYEFEPDSVSKKSDDEKKESQQINTINTDTRLRRSSSADHHIEETNSKKTKSGHLKSRSLAKFAARHRSETDGKFKTKSNKNLNFLKRNKKRTKTDAKLPHDEISENDILHSPRTKYVNNAINDKSNAGLTFDFGVRYYYWKYYKDNENKDKQWNHGTRYKYWYIQNKENNLKLEMLNLSTYNAAHNAQYKKSKHKKKEKVSLLSKASERTLKFKNKLSLKDNSSLKEDEEMNYDHNDDVSGNICGMNMEQWTDVEQRAHCLYRTHKCRQIKCGLSIWSREYGICEDDGIKKEHIISILIFCNFSSIRNEFILTFNQYYNTALLVEDMIKKTKNNKNNKFKIRSLFNYERGMEAMKKNHSYFAHLGRLLRESVECFGDRLNKNKFDEIFYFGINNGLGLFTTTISQFKLPLLCSTNINCVLNYMKINEMSDGLLVEMKYYQPFMRYFNCSFLTEFGCMENSVLFLGGISMLKIETIYSIFTPYNYRNFVRSMNILQAMLLGKMKKESMTENEEQIIRYLVQNEFIRSMNNDTDLTNNVNGNEIIPNYISLLFHHFCINLNFISINLHRMNDKTFYGYFGIKSLFLTSQNNFIKLDVLCSLFPNVPIIKIVGDNSSKFSTNCIKLDELFFEEVLLILDSNLISNKCALKKIIISYANESDMTLEQAIVKYQGQFKEKNCLLKIKVKTRELIIERINVHYYNAQNNSALQNHNDQQNACTIQ